MKLVTYSASGSKGSMTVDKAVFGAKVNQQLLSQAVRVYSFNQRQGTSRVKTRSEIKLTKKKWYRQKGTGNARHGAKSAHIFVGGGVAHGPKGIENWSRKLTKSMRRQAMLSALSAQAESIIVCDAISNLDGKTKSAVQILSKFSTLKDKVLVVLAGESEKTQKSMRNLPNVLLVGSDQLNTFNVAMADLIVFTKDSLKEVESRMTKNKDKSVEAVSKSKKNSKTNPSKSVSQTETAKK